LSKPWAFSGTEANASPRLDQRKFRDWRARETEP
jgi:hypothetical protein